MGRKKSFQIQGVPGSVENEEAGRQERLGRVWEAWERGL